VITKPALNGTVTPDPYSATIERTGDDTILVEYNGLEAEQFVSRALKNLERGYGCVPIGRVDPARPDVPPHKVAWCRGYHGYDARDGDAADIAAIPAKIIRRLALRGERGILNLAARVPLGMVGLDVDGYGNKSGLATLADHDQRLGRRLPTYFVTARGFDSGSGIYLYRIPDEWACVGVLPGGGVDTIQRHLRYLAAPGSLHQIGAAYQLYHEASGPKLLGFELPALDDPGLAPLPESWVAELSRRQRRRGGTVTSDDVKEFSETYNFNENPEMLDPTVCTVRYSIELGQTRNAYHRGLWIAARNARCGCYPFGHAVAQIEAAADAAYAHRGGQVDPWDFARSVRHAVTAALDMAPAEVVAWAIGRDGNAQSPRGVRVGAIQPALPRAPRRQRVR
jgi:hypothetical protein